MCDLCLIWWCWVTYESVGNSDSIKCRDQLVHSIHTEMFDLGQILTTGIKINTCVRETVSPWVSNLKSCFFLFRIRECDIKYRDATFPTFVGFPTL